MPLKRFASAAMVSGVTGSLLVAAAIGQQPEQHDHGAPAGRLGTVPFVTSCAPAVQNEFDRGVALLHSFWFSAAIESFNRVLEGRPAVRDGALGHRDELVGQPVRRLPHAAGAGRGPGRDRRRQGQRRRH